MNHLHADTRKYSLDPIPAQPGRPVPTHPTLPDLSDAARLARLEKFKFRAEIDFIVLEVKSTRATQARHLQGRLPIDWGAFVQEVDAPSSTYTVRLNDPPLDVAQIRFCLGRAGVDLDTEIPVRGIEISLDAYPADAFCESEAVDLAFETATTIGHHVSDLRIVTNNQGVACPTVAPTSLDLLEKLRQGGTCYNGNKWDPVFFRVYIKKTDRGVPLPEAEFRVRHEVNISDPELLPKSLDHLANYKFDALTKLFPVFKEHLSLVEPRSVRANLRRKLTELRPMLAQRWAAPKRRVKSRQLRNFPAIQQRRVYEPLRRLTRRVVDTTSNGMT